jgi:hypothetical protein
MQFTNLAKKAGVDPKDVILNFEAHAGGTQPKTVIQGGVKFQLNEKTGEYEPI